MEDLSQLMLANRLEATRWRASFRTAALGTWRRDVMRVQNALRRDVNLLFDLLVDEDDNDNDSPEKLVEECDECHVIEFSFFLIPRYRENCSWIFAILLERYIFYNETCHNL